MEGSRSRKLQRKLITFAPRHKESEDYARYSEKILNNDIYDDKGISTHDRYSPVVQDFIQALVENNLIKIRSNFRNRSLLNLVSIALSRGRPGVSR